MSSEYYKSEASVDEYIKMAKGHDGRSLIDKLRNFLPMNSTLLEIGSGPGSDWEILNEHFEVTGSDNSLIFLKRLAGLYPDGNFLELDASSLKTEKKFDGIYSNKVLHHLTDDEISVSVKNQYNILNRDGIICHSFWKGEGSEVYSGLFVNYYTETSIRHLLGKQFEILLIDEYKEFEKDDSLLVIGRKINKEK